MSKRNSRTEWLQAKALRKVTARLLSELLLTRDDKLDRFSTARVTADPRPDLHRLREVQEILMALGTAIQRGDEDAWSRLRLVWQLLVEDSGGARRRSVQESRQPTADSQPASEPAEPHEVAEAAPPEDDRRAGGPRKPNLADPAPAGRPSQPSRLAAPAVPPRPAALSVPPIAPRATAVPEPTGAVRPSQDSDEQTNASVVPNPQPVMPFHSSGAAVSPPPGRVAPPDPAAPAPPVAGARALGEAGQKPPWPGPEPRPDQPLGDEPTGMTAVLDADAVGAPPGSALPFSGAGLALLPIPADPDDADDVTEVLESSLSGELGGEAPESFAPEGVPTLVGQPPTFLARLQSITLDQYASIRAECELFPERVDEVRRVVGLVDDREMNALDELWRYRFTESRSLHSQFEEAVARYRVWLRQKGKE